MRHDDRYYDKSNMAGLCRAVMLMVYLAIAFTTAPIHAQTIGGNVYGGGNQADVEGQTRVVIGSDGQ